MKINLIFINKIIVEYVFPADPISYAIALIIMTDTFYEREVLASINPFPVQ